MPRTGRPPSDEPKTLNTRIRLSEYDKEMLSFCCAVYGITKAEVIRRGITLMCDQAIKVNRGSI